MKEIRGAKVDGFNPATGSGAEKAGMQAGDIIITADGNPVDRVSTLQRIIRNHAPGESVQLEVMRYGQKKSFSVRLTELAEPARTASADNATPERPAASTAPASFKSDALGITGSAVPGELATRANLAANRRGVLVTEVVPLGPAYNKLGERDVIFEVLFPAPRRPIRSTADLQNILNGLKDGDYVSLMFIPWTGAGADRVVNIRVALTSREL